MKTPKPFTNLIHAESAGALLRDLKTAAKVIDRDNARFLVKTYYQLQHERIVQSNRIEAMKKSGARSEHLEFMFDVFENLEAEIKTWLDKFTEAHPTGRWAREQYGVGPVLAAGLLAHLDMDKCPNISSLWAYAGYDPTRVWEKGKKCPHNGDLKTICWKLGEAFVKVMNNEEAKYGQIFKGRKQYEWAKNQRGEYAELEGRRNYKFGPTTESYKWMTGQYSRVDFTGTSIKGIIDESRPGIKMIPPGAIHERAKRFAVKRFLSDLWIIAYENHFGKPCDSKPWINTYGGHQDFVEPVRLQQ